MKDKAFFCPLDEVFSAPSHSPILRALMEYTQGLSGRALARAAGVNHQACALAVKRLEALGIVRRQGEGRTRLVSFDPRSQLVHEILLHAFRKEKSLRELALNEIRQMAGRHAVAATLFGGTNLLLVVGQTMGRHVLAGSAEALSQDLARKSGVRLSLTVLTVRELQMRFEMGDLGLERALKDGIDLGPKSLRSALQ
jgi:hypothetical protein